MSPGSMTESSRLYQSIYAVGEQGGFCSCWYLSAVFQMDGHKVTGEDGVIRN